MLLVVKHPTDDPKQERSDIEHLEDRMDKTEFPLQHTILLVQMLPHLIFRRLNI